MSYDTWKTTNPEDEFLGPEESGTCERCGLWRKLEQCGGAWLCDECEDLHINAEDGELI